MHSLYVLHPRFPSSYVLIHTIWIHHLRQFNKDITNASVSMQHKLQKAQSWRHPWLAYLVSFANTASEIRRKTGSFPSRSTLGGWPLLLIYQLLSQLLTPALVYVEEDSPDKQAAEPSFGLIGHDDYDATCPSSRDSPLSEHVLERLPSLKGAAPRLLGRLSIAPATISASATSRWQA